MPKKKKKKKKKGVRFSGQVVEEQAPCDKASEGGESKDVVV